MSSAEDTWTVGRLLNWTVEYLGKHGSENPRLDAEVLLAHARASRRIDLYAAFNETATDDLRNTFRELVKRRAAGTPVAYLVGHREFYSLEFEVTPDVLIPRPETELLVVALLDRVKARRDRAVTQSAPAFEHPASLLIADVGTGSGILAVCAAKFIPVAHVIAIDVSSRALAVARRNAERHNVADRITFVEANLLSFELPEPKFDLIVSNPPYVSAVEMGQLAPDVGEHEPHVALCAGESGTAIITPLIEQAAERLKPGGALLIEVSPMIAEAVEGLISEQPALEPGSTLKDLAGHARVIQATRRSRE